MAWDPTDYKDMLDDDWNSINDHVKQKWEEMASEGYDLNSIVSEVCQILGNMPAYEDIIDWVNENDTEEIDEAVKYVMDHFYLTPIARKKAKMKIQENNSKDMTRGKYVNENLDDFENEDPKWLHDDSGPDDDVDGAATGEVINATGDALVDLFQQAAENGLTFEMLKEITENALDQVDWVAAGQM